MQHRLHRLGNCIWLGWLHRLQHRLHRLDSMPHCGPIRLGRRDRVNLGSRNLCIDMWWKLRRFRHISSRLSLGLLRLQRLELDRRGIWINQLLPVADHKVFHQGEEFHLFIFSKLGRVNATNLTLRHTTKSLHADFDLAFSELLAQLLSVCQACLLRQLPVLHSGLDHRH